MKRYETEHSFYAEEANSIGATRSLSPELDFGYHRGSSNAVGRNYRVSFVDDTGEIYAVSMVGNMPVEVLGVVAGEDEAEALLKGWEDAPDLNWFRERCRQLPC